VGRRILTGDDVWLYRVSLGTNASKPYARIRCRPAPGGSSVEVTIGLRPAGRIGFAVWFGFIGLFTLSSFTNIVSSSWWEALIGLLVGPHSLVQARCCSHSVDCWPGATRGSCSAT